MDGGPFGTQGYLMSKKSMLVRVNKRKSTDLKHLNNPKVFLEHPNDMDVIYQFIEAWNSNKKRKVLILFDDIITDMRSNKKLNPIVTELFIRRRKLNISLVFIAQYFFFCFEKY